MSSDNEMRNKVGQEGKLRAGESPPPSRREIGGGGIEEGRGEVRRCAVALLLKDEQRRWIEIE